MKFLSLKRTYNLAMLTVTLVGAFFVLSMFLFLQLVNLLGLFYSMCLVLLITGVFCLFFYHVLSVYLIKNKKVVDTVAEFKDLNASKNLFLASVSHELKTPLNSMSILLDLIVKNKEKNLSEKQLDYLFKIMESNFQLKEIIVDILDWSQIEAGKIKVNKSRVELQTLMDRLNHRFKFIADKKGVQLDCVIMERCPTHFFSDDQKLAHILNNLVSNAVKFTNEGSVFITVERRGDFLQFKVSDTGVGIPQKLHPYIFEPFVQSEKDLFAQEITGTGLGLSIAQKFASTLGGRVYLDYSSSQGTQFIFELPYVKTTG